MFAHANTQSVLCTVAIGNVLYMFAHANTQSATAPTGTPIATATAKDGLTIGNSIYILNELGAMDDVTADFLSHEGGHVISASAVGVVKFIEYNATASYDESNISENTAYQFGGLANQNDFPSININNQVPDQYPGWWK